MRIIPNDTEIPNNHYAFGRSRDAFFKGQQSVLSHTIEITDAEINQIFGYFIANEVVMAGYAGVNGDTLDFQTRGGKSFAQYLRELIALKEIGK